MNPTYIRAILDEFLVPKGKINFRLIESGIINKTYEVELRGNAYRHLILQGINTNIFPNIDGLMNNVVQVCQHITNQLQTSETHIKYVNLHYYPTRQGNYYFQTQEAVYRLMDYIENAPITSKGVSNLTAAEAGKTLGHFHLLTQKIDPGKLIETMPDFHRLDKRYAHFRTIPLEGNQRYLRTQSFYTKVLEFEHLVDRYRTILNGKELPIKIVHNDPKLSNILFDKNGYGITMIDLDTVMPGYLNNDIGDAIRSLTNTSDENEQDLERVNFNFLLFQHFIKAYLKVMKGQIEPKEKEHLALFALLLTFEQLIRFYGDFLAGDIYYQTSYPDQNLQRAKVQYQLLHQMFQKFEDMQRFISTQMT